MLQQAAFNAGHFLLYVHLGSGACGSPADLVLGSVTHSSFPCSAPLSSKTIMDNTPTAALQSWLNYITVHTAFAFLPTRPLPCQPWPDGIS